MCVFFTFVTLPVFAGNYYGNQQNKSQQQNGNKNYQGYTGQQYQYDLNNQADNIRYQLDSNAQIRDELNSNPKAEIDRSLGQRGGGVRW